MFYPLDYIKILRWFGLVYNVVTPVTYDYANSFAYGFLLQMPNVLD